MKKSLFFLLVVGVLASQGLIAQTSATTTVVSRVTVIDPIRIRKTADLDFGNVISAYTSGKIIISPDGSRSAFGVQVSTSLPGNISPAAVEVTHGNNSYTITLSDSYTLYNTENPNQTVIINDFQVEPVGGNGIEVIRIGATLNLEANQFSGLYTNNEGFNVTVSYN